MIEQFPAHVRKGAYADYFGVMARIDGWEYYDAGPVHNTSICLVKVGYITPTGRHSAKVPVDALEPLTKEQQELLQAKQGCEISRTTVKMRYRGQSLDIVFG